MRVSLREGNWKSLSTPFVWNNIPSFVVVTGPNGAGKTHLLELIYEGIRVYSRMPQSPRRPENRPIIVDPVNYTIEQVQFLRAGWNFGNPAEASQASVSQRVSQIISELQGRGGIPSSLRAVADEIHARTRRSVDQMTRDELATELPAKAIYSDVIDSTRILEDMAQVFHHYYLQSVTLRVEQGLNDDAIKQRLGEPPWDVVNQVFSTAGLSHCVIRPSSLTVAYKLCTVGPTSAQIEPKDLSSGEKTLLGLTLLLFNSRRNGIAPKLLLLDEPDAHLHPAVIRGFYDALRNVISRDFNCQVIATTHRPDTIALLEPTELMEMFPTGERIRSVASVPATLARISANVLRVIKNTRCVIVEDRIDVTFYNTIRELIETECGLSLDPIPIFQPASTKSVPGGSTVVQEWVKKLASSGLEQLIHGLVDRDSGQTVGPNIHVLNRYAIENYIFDPLNVYESLLNNNRPPKVPGVSLFPGSSSMIKALPQEALQNIVDCISAPIIKRMGFDSNHRTEVHFTTGARVQYVTDFITRRGHDFAQHVHEEFKLSSEQLMAGLLRLRMVQQDLVDLFRSLSAP